MVPKSSKLDLNQLLLHLDPFFYPYAKKNVLLTDFRIRKVIVMAKLSFFFFYISAQKEQTSDRVKMLIFLSDRKHSAMTFPAGLEAEGV